MDHDVFLRRLGSLDPRDPPPDGLEAILIDALFMLEPWSRHASALRRTFRLSYEGHTHAPPRASGEAYIFHIMRATLEAMRMMQMFGVCNIDLILQLLLHDTVEDAREGGHHPVLMRTSVLATVGFTNARGVSLLTKHDLLGRVKPHYYRELRETTLWEPIASKHIDRIDNIRTLDSMPLEKRQRKLQETEREFPALTEAMFRNVFRNIEQGRFHEGYIPLSGLIAETLKHAIADAYARIRLP